MQDEFNPVYPVDDAQFQNIIINIPDNFNYSYMYTNTEYKIDLLSYITNTSNIQLQYTILSGPGSIVEDHFYFISKNLLKSGNYQVKLRIYNSLNIKDVIFNINITELYNQISFSIPDQQIYSNQVLEMTMTDYIITNSDIYKNIYFEYEYSNELIVNNDINYIIKFQFDDSLLQIGDSKIYNVTQIAKDKISNEILKSETFSINAVKINTIPTKPINLSPSKCNDVNIKNILFSWNESYSSEFEVLYNIFLSEDNNNFTILQKNLGTQYYKMDNKVLSYDKFYYWKIEQFNSKNESTFSEVNQFKTKKSQEYNNYIGFMNGGV